MRSASPELRAHLEAGGPYMMADLYEIALRSGETLYWTSWERELHYQGHSYQPVSWPCVPTVKRGRVRIVAGLQVDTLDMTIGSAGAANLGGIPMGLAAVNGALDGAQVTLRRVFMPQPGDTSLGALLLFEGDVAGIDQSSTELRLSIKSLLEKLTLKIPQKLFMPQCSHAVYDAGCALERDDFSDTGTLSVVTSAIEFETTLTEANGWYDLGVIAFTSGINVGVRRSVSDYLQADGAVKLGVPLPVLPSVGDAFTIYPGCNKTRATCADKFNNIVHFRGFPFVPKPEQIR